MLKNSEHIPDFKKGPGSRRPTPAKGFRMRGIGVTRKSHAEPKYRRKMRQASQRQLRAWKQRK
jgi:hypothetical protein